VFKKLELTKVLEVLPLDSDPLLLDIPYKGLENSDFMNFSKMLMPKFLVHFELKLKDKKLSIETEKFAGLFLLLVPKLLLILSSAHGKLLKLKCKLPNLEYTLLIWSLPSTN
jgi:hypothetical protein